MSTLLQRFRRVHALLEDSGGRPVSFPEVASILAEVIGADVLVVSRKGRILASAPPHPDRRGRSFSPSFNARLLEIQSTSPLEGGTAKEPSLMPGPGGRRWTSVPVGGSGERLGTLLLAHAAPLSEEQIVLAETGAAVVAMEILRSRAEAIDLEERQRTAAQVALQSLSFSELEAVRAVFEELQGADGLLVASRVADRAGITRSVIVNALRKLESAGLLEARSLGMKGTHIRVQNGHLTAELERAVR